jgi:hypothetical protein
VPAAAREAPFTVRVPLPGGVWPDDRSEGEAKPVREVALRAVGGEDEVFILETDGVLPGARATALLARCLSGGDRLAHTLTVGDREALLLHLRRLTIGEVLDCILRCPAESCGEPMEIALGVGDLLVAPYREVRPSYDVIVEAEGACHEVCFRLPTAADLEDTAVLARRDPEQGASEILRRCVLRAVRNGIVLDAMDLPATVRSAVAGAMAERDPQAELELDLCCPACGTSFSTLFDTATFFLRELEERATRLLGEVHTLALHYHWSEAEILSLPARRRAQYLTLVAGAQARAGAQ